MKDDGYFVPVRAVSGPRVGELEIAVEVSLGAKS